MIRRNALIIGLLLGLVLSVSTEADEPELLSVEAEGILDLHGQSRIEVVGTGHLVSLRSGRPGELRYMARSRDNRRESRPVQLWLGNRTLIFAAEPAAEEGADPERLILEIAIAPEVQFKLDITDGRIAVSGMDGVGTIRGRDSDLEMRGCGGRLDIDVERGKVLLDGLSQDATFVGREVELALKRHRGSLALTLVKSQAELSGLGGRLDADLEETTLAARAIAGEVRITAREGSVRLDEIQGGADLRLDDTPAALTGSNGPVVLETSAEVRLKDHTGEIELSGHGGPLRGAGITGALTVSMAEAEVQLEGLKGPGHIEGDGLTIHVNGSQKLTIRSRSSSIHVEKPEGEVDIENDFGDVTVREATQKVKIANRNGNIVVHDLAAPLEIVSDSEMVDVAWKQIDVGHVASVENESGEVRLSLPARGGGLIDARSSYGEIITSVPEVEVSNDGRSAQWNVRRSGKPKIQVKSVGNVYIERPVAGRRPPSAQGKP